MSFRDLIIKDEYRSNYYDISKDFYIPILEEAIIYKRAVGYFSSSALAQISKGISGLAKNQGKIQLVASPHLSPEDVEAIKQGYENRNEIIKESLLKELRDPENTYEKNQLDLLAKLIAGEILEIKIAFLEENNSIGLFHEKMGIIEDSEGNKIAFSGSMNETKNALKINYEAIDVFCSWQTEFEKKKVIDKENRFNQIWDNEEKGIKIIEFPEISEEILKRYENKMTSLEDYIEEDELYGIKESYKEYVVEEKRGIPKIPAGFKFHDYQKEAIEEWERQDYKGIFDMATGTGKTYTGLGALVRLSEKLDHNLGVIIVCPYQHLVEQWVEDIEKFNINPIIGYSSSSQKEWKDILKNAIRLKNLGVKDSDFFCFICTNATFASDYVQSLIDLSKNEILIIVDEAHNFGSMKLIKLLDNRFYYRLALSATMDRHNDIQGTLSLMSFFGNKCISYDLSRAIDEKKLTKYKYYPILVSLNETELEKYISLTNEISRCISKNKNGKIKLSERGKRLAIERSRVVAGAEEKLFKLRENIKGYLKSNHILIYCGATNVLDENQNIKIDEDEIRQIDAVTNILGNELNMKVAQFTSKENIKTRKIITEEFKKGFNLQALVAIKCLDEGVNIPSIKTAFILASTTNPKEYIQRRGRVLRISENKEYAEIFDFITLTRNLKDLNSLTEYQIRKEQGLIKNELKRGHEFARLSINSIEAESILLKIKDSYLIKDSEEGWSYE